MSGAAPLRDWVATAPTGAASVLAEELVTFGATDVRERRSDVKFRGDLEVGYRACLWSRTATRVLLTVGEVEAASAPGLHAALTRIDWRDHLATGATLACDCSGGNEAIRHTLYGSKLLKDAVCDALRETTGVRPDVRPERPDVPLHLHVEGARAVVSVDFAGESLHRRGYRGDSGRAPLKENVAAAVLLRSGWPGIAERGGALVDPMCGSGTLLIEGALIAADAAPGLERGYFGFLGWHGHDAALWLRLLDEAWMRRRSRPARRCVIGSDVDAAAVRIALDNAACAGVAEWVHVERRPLSAVRAPPSAPGLVAVNPPYGERIGDPEELPATYAELGRVLREHFSGWQAAVLTGDPGLAARMGIYAKRSHRLFNGQIDCRLLRFDLAAPSVPRAPEAARAQWASREGAAMFANRLRKNLNRLEPWALREGIECYRLYDADMPEYAFAVDLYGRDERHAFVQEYAPPRDVDPEAARRRRREALAALPEALGLPLTRVHTRVRRPQKGARQYEKRGEAAQRQVVREGGLEFLVNFSDYLDTGLFLDHRMVRARLRAWAAGGDFLNLFCYTGTATVYAAAGGARSSLSLDLSATYLEWALANLRLNGLSGPQHVFERADCLRWLESAAGGGPRFDLIFLDPPTFSNSKKMLGVLDVQRDHARMLTQALHLLRRNGRLVFSTNYTRFKLDREALADVAAIEDLTAATLPRDFERNPRIRQCFLLRHAADAAAEGQPSTSRKR